MNFFSPLLNASLNGLSACLLALGYLAIRSKRIKGHRFFMSSAFLSSTLFLISYLSYHAQHGSTKFGGQGWIRTLYFSILISHTILAVVILPLILMTFRLALKGALDQHKAWARWTLPLWFYVSVTGVVIYWMLYQM